MYEPTMVPSFWPYNEEICAPRKSVSGWRGAVASGLLAMLPVAATATRAYAMPQESSPAQTAQSSAPVLAPQNQARHPLKIGDHTYDVIENADGTRSYRLIDVANFDKKEVVVEAWDGDEQKTLVVSEPQSKGRGIFGYTQYEGQKAKTALEREAKEAKERGDEDADSFRLPLQQAQKSDNALFSTLDIWAPTPPLDKEIVAIEQSNQNFWTQLASAKYVPPHKQKRGFWKRFGADLKSSAKETVMGAVGVVMLPVTLPRAIERHHKVNKLLNNLPDQVTRRFFGDSINVRPVSQQGLDAALAVFLSGGVPADADPDTQALGLYLADPFSKTWVGALQTPASQMPASAIPVPGQQEPPTSQTSQTQEAAPAAPATPPLIAQTPSVAGSAQAFLPPTPSSPLATGSKPSAGRVTMHPLSSAQPAASDTIAASKYIPIPKGPSAPPVPPELKKGGPATKPYLDRTTIVSLVGLAALVLLAGASAIFVGSRDRRTKVLVEPYPPYGNVRREGRFVRFRQKLRHRQEMLAAGFLAGLAAVGAFVMGRRAGEKNSAAAIPSRSRGEAIKANTLRFGKNLWDNKDTLVVGAATGMITKSAFAAAATALTAHSVAAATVATMVAPWVLPVALTLAGAMLAGAATRLVVTKYRSMRKGGQKLEGWGWMWTATWQGALGGLAGGLAGATVHHFWGDQIDAAMIKGYSALGKAWHGTGSHLAPVAPSAQVPTPNLSNQNFPLHAATGETFQPGLPKPPIDHVDVIHGTNMPADTGVGLPPAALSSSTPPDLGNGAHVVAHTSAAAAHPQVFTGGITDIHHAKLNLRANWNKGWLGHDQAMQNAIDGATKDGSSNIDVLRAYAKGASEAGAHSHLKIESRMIEHGAKFARKCGLINQWTILRETMAVPH